MTITDLHQQMSDYGYEKEMRDILHENIYLHAAFAAPQDDSQNTDQQDIIAKWLEIWEAMQQKEAQKQRATEWKNKV